MIGIIKQNVMLFTILILSFVCSVLLLFAIFYKNMQRMETIDRFVNLKSKIMTLYTSKPSPNTANIQLLTKDISEMKKANFEFQNVFGNIYLKPLIEMIRSLNESETQRLQAELKKPKLPAKEADSVNKRLEKLKTLSEYEFQQDFLARWKEYIEKEKQSEIDIKISEILDRFSKEYGFTKEDTDKAGKACRETMTKMTFEDVTDANVKDYILEALGINVGYSKVRCKTLVMNIQQSLTKYLQDADVKLPDGKLELFQELATLPSDSQIPYIIQYARFLDDLFSRVADTHVDSITSYKRLNGLQGTVQGNFTVLKYQIGLAAHQDDLRSFINSLQAGYIDNRIYVVTSISFKVASDDAEQIKPYDQAIENLQKQIKIQLDTPPLINALIDIKYIIYNRNLL